MKGAGSRERLEMSCLLAVNLLEMMTSSLLMLWPMSRCMSPELPLGSLLEPATTRVQLCLWYPSLTPPVSEVKKWSLTPGTTRLTALARRTMRSCVTRPGIQFPCSVILRTPWWSALEIPYGWPPSMSDMEAMESFILCVTLPSAIPVMVFLFSALSRRYCNLRRVVMWSGGNVLW